MIKRYKFSTFDYTVDLELDTSKLTVADAIDIATFWSGWKEVQEVCKGSDPYEAVARWAACSGLYYAMDGYNMTAIPKQIQSQEGWYDHDFGLKFHNIEFAERHSADEWVLEQEDTKL